MNFRYRNLMAYIILFSPPNDITVEWTSTLSHFLVRGTMHLFFSIRSFPTCNFTFQVPHPNSSRSNAIFHTLHVSDIHTGGAECRSILNKLLSLCLHTWVHYKFVGNSNVNGSHSGRLFCLKSYFIHVVQDSCEQIPIFWNSFFNLIITRVTV